MKYINESSKLFKLFTTAKRLLSLEEIKKIKNTWSKYIPNALWHYLEPNIVCICALESVNFYLLS